MGEICPVSISYCSKERHREQAQVSSWQCCSAAKWSQAEMSNESLPGLVKMLVVRLVWSRACGFGGAWRQVLRRLEVRVAGGAHRHWPGGPQRGCWDWEIFRFYLNVFLQVNLILLWRPWRNTGTTLKKIYLMQMLMQGARSEIFMSKIIFKALECTAT